MLKLDSFIQEHLSVPSKIKGWKMFFVIFHQAILAIKELNKKIFVSFDEIHWFDGQNKFISHFASSWNKDLVFIEGLYVFLTSSVSSWNYYKLDQHDSLYSRFDLNITLEPFTIEEIINYCENSYQQVNRLDVCKYYLMFGGIIKYYHYLNLNKSFEWNLKQLSENSNHLIYEQKQLFQSLFGYKKLAKESLGSIESNSLHYYEMIILILCKSKSLLFSKIKEKLQKECKKKNINPPADMVIRRCLENLELSHLIISSTIDDYKQAKTFMIKDLFCYFIYYWHDLTLLQKEDQFYSTWKGTAFEIFILNNFHLIKSFLNTDGLSFVINWRDSATVNQEISGKSKKKSLNFQIDLLLKENYQEEIYYVVENKMCENGYKLNKLDILAMESKIDNFKTDFFLSKKTSPKTFPLYVTFNGFSEVGVEQSNHLNFDLAKYVKQL